MKLPTFRKDAAAGLAKAQAALTAANGRIAELEIDRLTALQESDAIEPIHALDLQIAGQRAAAATHADRVQVLRAALKEQRAEQMEAQRQAAIAEIEKRLAGQIELAKEVEAAVKQLGSSWEKLLHWRQAILGGWPAELPRPLASDFEDVRIIRRELANALHAAGKPAWDRQCSVPAPAGPVGVEGLSPKGLANAVAAAGAAFIARVKNTRIQSTDDSEEAA
jgi:hypothetical protein